MPLTQEIINAVKAGDIVKVKSFLNANPESINEHTTDGLSLLQLTILNKQNELVKYLVIEHQVDITGMIEYANLVGNQNVISFFTTTAIPIPETSNDSPKNLGSSGSIKILAKSNSSSKNSFFGSTRSEESEILDENPESKINQLKKKLRIEFLKCPTLNITSLNSLLQKKDYKRLNERGLISIFSEFDSDIQDELQKRKEEEKKYDQALKLVRTLFEPKEENTNTTMEDDTIFDMDLI